MQGIVRAHHGGIKVSSALGKGSTFRVLLPAAEAQAPQITVRERVDGSREKGAILVVEDDPIVRRMTLAALSQDGFEVRAAENGTIAVEMFKEMADQISLVLLDLVMPVMGGEEALVHIRKIRPGVPVVISSGHNEVDSIELFSHAGVDGIVTKPYIAQQLVEKLKAALEKRASVRTLTSEP